MEIREVTSGILPKIERDKYASGYNRAVSPNAHRHKAEEPTRAADGAKKPIERPYDPEGLRAKEAPGGLKGILDKAPESVKEDIADIIEIVRKNSPHILAALRAILAERLRSGADNGVFTADIEADLKEALVKADKGPDPSKRSADLVLGLSRTPPGTERDFLAAASGMIDAENEAARAAAGAAPTGDVGAVSDEPERAGYSEALRSIETNETTGTYEVSGGPVSLDVNFDLFFSLTERTSVKATADGSRSFYEASRSVTAEFSAGFSIKAVGGYLDRADIAEKLGGEVFDAFNKAVGGLAGLDDEALARFYAATDDLFDKIGVALAGDADRFDNVADEMKSSAEAFFRAVHAASRDLFPGLEPDKIFTLPGEMDSNGTKSLLDMIDEAASGRVGGGKVIDDLLAALARGTNHEAGNVTADDADAANAVLGNLGAAA